MNLTKRDELLLKRLANYGMLSTAQINQLIFSSIAKTTVLRRLRILEEANFIKRLVGLESQEVLWIITEKSKQFSEGEHYKRNWNKNLLEHDFKLLKLRLLLEERRISKSWVPEHEIRYLVFKKHGVKTASKMLVPDGLMVTELSNIKISVAIELELTLKNKERIKEILTRYKEKKDLNTLWYLCDSPAIINSIERTWKNLRDQSSIKLYCSLFDDVMKNPEKSWIGKAAHSPAQPLSRVGLTQKESLSETSRRNQNNLTPINSPPFIASATDHPLPTCLDSVVSAYG
jgi:DNA-binding Lrp family transcriptional regulator